MIPSSPDLRATFQARVGQMLNGKWRIDRLIDVGGMGAVYAATHRNGRHAAIKLLHRHYASNAEVRSRFQREGYVANKIDHPGAVAVLDDDIAEDGSPFLVMELLEGESLSTLISNRGGTLRIPEALAIAGQVLEVLSIAHPKGIVHRDIKPGNVFITSAGHAKLLDFGLARIRDGTSTMVPTAAGVVMGTAGYMAPEQARGLTDQIDLRTDIFSVGAVLYRAISGRRIHERTTVFDMTLAAMKDPVPSFATAMPGANLALVHAIDRSLAFDKRARWQSAQEMFEALRLAYQQLETIASEPTIHAPTGIGASEVVDGPSLAIEVAFGEDHETVISTERRRTREAVEGISVAVDPGDARSR